MKFFLEIISPEGKVFEGQVEKAIIPSVTGILTILAHHALLFTTLKKGIIKVIDEDGRVQTFPLSKGVAEVTSEKVTLLIESPESSEEALASKTKIAQEEIAKIKKIKPKDELISPAQQVRRGLGDLSKIKRKRKSQFVS